MKVPPWMQFVLFFIVFCGLIAANRYFSGQIDFAAALLFKVLIVVASAVLLWRALRYGPNGATRGDVLPPRVRRWVEGASLEQEPKKARVNARAAAAQWPSKRD